MSPNPNPQNTLPVACFAPPLDDDKLAYYYSLIDGLPRGEVSDALTSCMKCVEAWWALPVSKRKDGMRISITHDKKNILFQLTPLEPEQIATLDATTPWMRELHGYRDLFDTLPTGGSEVQENVNGSNRSVARIVDKKTHDIRNMAFHLLWHAMEITLDREPTTLDVLPVRQEVIEVVGSPPKHRRK